MRKKYIINGNKKAVAVVLGKYLNDDGGISHELRERLSKAFLCYQSGLVGTLILSGGQANTNAPLSEAHAMRDYLIKRGVKEEDLILEDKSRNTYENARECADILDGYELSELYLITSAKHNYRSYFNPRRFFRSFNCGAVDIPSFDCNVYIENYDEDKQNELVYYAKQSDLENYKKNNGERNLFFKRKFGLIRRYFFPKSVWLGKGKNAELLKEELEGIYEKPFSVTVL